MRSEGENGEEWWRMVENGREWWRMVKNGGEWWRMVENGTEIVRGDGEIRG